MKRLLLALALLVWPAVAGAQEAPVPPPPTRWATDTAGFLSPAALDTADRTLRDYERATGNQVLLWIGTTTGDTPLEDWTVKAFERWKVGRAGLDNGLVLFVFANDRRVRIEVGYGLEGEVPDAVASRILAEDVLPRIRAGDRDGAVLNGIAAVQAAIAGTPHTGVPGAAAPAGSAAEPETYVPPPSNPFHDLIAKIVMGILAIGFVILLFTNPQLALYILFSILSSGGSGGGRSGGGGWSGGGGRSGGGGASGSW